MKEESGFGPYTISRYLKNSFNRNKVGYGLSYFATAAGIANNIVGPYLLAQGISSLQNSYNNNDDDYTAALPWFATYVGSWVGSRVLTLINDEILTSLSTKLSHTLTMDVMKAYFSLPMEQTNSSAGSEAVHHFGIAYEQIGRSFIDGLSGKIIPATIELPIALTFVSYQFGYIGLVLGGAIFSNSALLIAQLRKVANAQNGYVLGLFKAYEFIISQVDRYENAHYFDAVKRELSELSKTLTVLDTTLVKSILVRKRALYIGSDLVSAATLLGTSLFYFYDPFDEKMSLNSFIWLLLYTTQIFPTFDKFFEASNKLFADYATFKALVKYLNSSQDDSDYLQKKKLTITTKEAGICFQDVFFNYSNKQLILDGASFVIKPGETVVITGESGAGKSSIFKLLQRFYKPQEGKISIAGNDINEINVETLRSAIAIVPQSPVLQNDTIYENIKYANVNASHEEIEEAARMAGLENLIAQKGFDFIVGANGAKLSGGQRQRVAIARAYLRKHSPILLMDEPTSSLDPQTEREILYELDKLLSYAQRTTLIITHRLCAIQFLSHIDTIIYLDGGVVAEQGTYEELMEYNGLFAKQMKIAKKEQKLYDKQKERIIQKAPVTRFSFVGKPLEPLENQAENENAFQAEAKNECEITITDFNSSAYHG